MERIAFFIAFLIFIAVIYCFIQFCNIAPTWAIYIVVASMLAKIGIWLCGISSK